MPTTRPWFAPAFGPSFQSEPDLEVIGEAADGEAAVELARRLHPDVVLMDIRMPQVDGLEATRRISSDSELALVRVLILTTFEADEYVFEALRVGASGLCSKTSSPSISCRRSAWSPPARHCSRPQ